jgi:DNA-binding CsgD family transcriptional regulator
MPGARWDLDRMATDVAGVGRRALPRAAYFAEVAARFRRVVDCEAMCWHTLDPMTRLMTSDAPQELVSAGVFTAESAPQAGAAVVASEYLGQDFNTFASLAGRRLPVATLTEATGHRPERSARYRDVLSPAGIPFEMRAALVTRGRAWGAVHVARREDTRDFTREDVDALARITATVAEGIRTSVRFDAARRGGDGGAPGMVVLDASDHVELITPAAREMLPALHHPAMKSSEETPPTAVVAVAGFARHRLPDAPHHGDGVAVPSTLGWITLHASLPDGPATGRVAIVMERTTSPQATAVRLEAHGVTAREREIAGLLAAGLSNPEIAQKLVLSPYTVQDHVKSLYEKTSVSSRQELIARVFLDDYLPNLAGETPLGADGAFAP